MVASLLPPFGPHLKSLDSDGTVSTVFPKDFGSFIDIELNLVCIFMGLLLNHIILPIFHQE